MSCPNSAHSHLLRVRHIEPVQWRVLMLNQLLHCRDWIQETLFTLARPAVSGGGQLVLGLGQGDDAELKVCTLVFALDQPGSVCFEPIFLLLLTLRASYCVCRTSDFFSAVKAQKPMGWRCLAPAKAPAAGVPPSAPSSSEAYWRPSIAMPGNCWCVAAEVGQGER